MAVVILLVARVASPSSSGLALPEVVVLVAVEIGAAEEQRHDDEGLEEGAGTHDDETSDEGTLG